MHLGGKMTWIKAGHNWGYKGKIFELSHHLLSILEEKVSDIHKQYDNPGYLEKIFDIVKGYSSSIPDDCILCKIDFPMNKHAVQFFVLHDSFPEIPTGGELKWRE